MRNVPAADEHGYWTRTPAGGLYYQPNDPATEDDAADDEACPDCGCERGERQEWDGGDGVLYAYVPCGCGCHGEEA